MILIFTRLQGYEFERLNEEAKKLSINIKFNELRDYNPLDFKLDKIPDVAFFATTQGLLYDSRIFAKELFEQGCRVVDRVLLEGWVLTKTRILYEAKKMHIPFPRTLKIYKYNKIEELYSLGFPLVAKHDLSHRGRKVYLIRNESELKAFLNKIKSNTSKWLFQEYIPYEKDIRILIIGEKILGAMERINPNSFKANISLGGVGRPYEVPDYLKEIALRIKERIKLDIAAVDFLLYRNQYYLIEVNKCPQFRGFETYVGKNVAREILLFLRSLEKT